LDHLGELKAICGDNEDLFAELKKLIASKLDKEEHEKLTERVNDLEEKSEVLDSNIKTEAAKSEMNHLNAILATETNSKAISAISDDEIPKIWDAIRELQARPLANGDPAPAPVIQQVVKQEKIDLSAYASKKSPDNTIVRIEKLEEELADLIKKY